MYQACNYEETFPHICSALGAYAHACSSRGVLLWGWRNSVDNCSECGLWWEGWRGQKRQGQELRNDVSLAHNKAPVVSLRGFRTLTSAQPFLCLLVTTSLSPTHNFLS